MFTIQKSRPEANIPRTIRFTEPLFEELHQTASIHEISFNSLVLQCCRYALDRMREEAGRAEETKNPRVERGPHEVGREPYGIAP